MENASITTPAVCHLASRIRALDTSAFSAEETPCSVAHNYHISTNGVVEDVCFSNISINAFVDIFSYRPKEINHEAYLWTDEKWDEFIAKRSRKNGTAPDYIYVDCLNFTKEAKESKVFRLTFSLQGHLRHVSINGAIKAALIWDCSADIPEEIEASLDTYEKIEAFVFSHLR